VAVGISTSKADFYASKLSARRSIVCAVISMGKNLHMRDVAVDRSQQETINRIARRLAGVLAAAP